MYSHNFPENKESDKFKEHTGKISASFKQLAQKLDYINKELPEKITNLKSVIQVVSKSWQPQVEETFDDEDDGDEYFNNQNEETKATKSSNVPSRVRDHLNTY